MEIIDPQPSDHFMPYSLGIKIKAGTDMLYLSGQTALPLYHDHPHLPPEEYDIPEDAYDQTILVMECMKEILDAAGATFQDLVSSEIYVTDMADQGKVGKAISEYADGHYPCGTMLEVNRLVVPGLKVEINAVAALPSP